MTLGGFVAGFAGFAMPSLSGKTGLSGQFGYFIPKERGISIRKG
jgi:hypothetical protein